MQRPVLDELGHAGRNPSLVVAARWATVAHLKAGYGEGLPTDRFVAVQQGEFVAPGCALPVAGNEAGVCAGGDRCRQAGVDIRPQ